MGSVFSPYYNWAGHRDPENHVAINVCLYGPRGNLWAMTERGRGALSRETGAFRVGPSGLDWDGRRLRVEFDEVTAPLPRRIRGSVTLWPEAVTAEPLALDAGGRHRWWPIAPMARVEVKTDRPGFGWRGHGYFDSNWGAEMLEHGFRRWDWSRALTSRGAAVLYDMTMADGTRRGLALEIGRDGAITPFEPPPRQPLPRGFWGVRRFVQTEAGGARIVRRMEDAPFYTRAALETHLMGERVPAVHETLDCRRFANPLVRMMLPVRMPRRGGFSGMK